MTKSQFPVGIDLGTTFSAIAHLDNQGRPCTVPNSEGELTTPSVVFFDTDTVIVGTEAQVASETDFDRVARSVKRDMGGQRYRKTIMNRHLPPEVLQSFVLKRLKDDAELRLGEFTKAVITVPAYFNEPRRKSTQDAGQLAGLDVIDIINEPTAAALAYGVQKGFLSEKGESSQKEIILVYDLGGGTFDVTLMEIEENNYRAIGTAGDVYLGGIDWDRRIYEFAKKQIEDRYNVNFDEDYEFQEKLMNESVRAKKSLTARTETAIRIDFHGQRFKVEIDREQFEELTRDLLERTRLTTERLLRDAKIGWNDLTRLLLVGGSTRMPMVAEMLEKESGLTVDRSLSPDESVAHGAAIYAGILMKHGSPIGDGIAVTNVNSHDLGVLGVDPKTGEPRRRIVIPRNHTLPTRSSKKFLTARDGQQRIIVRVVEGGTDEGKGATVIGKCVVSDLPAEIKKGTEVLVGFNYLASGRLQVLAEIPTFNLRANTTIDRASGMTPEEIEQWQQRLKLGIKFIDQLPTAEAKVDQGNSSSSPVSKSVPPQTVTPQPVTPQPVPQRGQDPKASPARASSPAAAKRTGAPGGKPRKPAPGKSPSPSRSADSLPSIESGVKKPDPFSGSRVEIELADEDRGLESIQFEDEDSAVFAFGDEGPANRPGKSALDFLDENAEKRANASGSALDDFLSELED